MDEIEITILDESFSAETMAESEPEIEALIVINDESGQGET